MIYVPHDVSLKTPYVQHPPLGWVSVMTSMQPVVWLRMNTASGSENNLGNGGGTVQYGAGVTRNASGGPVAGGGYATTTTTTSTNMYIRSQVSSMWTTFTVGAFVRLSAAGQTVFSKREYFASATNAFPYALTWDQPNARVQVNLDSGNDFSADQTISTPNNSIPTSEWIMLTNVVRPSGSPVEVFVNSTLAHSTSATTTVATGSTIPQWACAQSNEYSGGAGGSECPGDWAEFFVFNRALSATEIANLYGNRLSP